MIKRLFKRVIYQAKLLYKLWYIINNTSKGMCNNWEIFENVSQTIYEIEESYKECTLNTEMYKVYENKQREWENKFYDDFMNIPKFDKEIDLWKDVREYESKIHNKIT